MLLGLLEVYFRIRFFFCWVDLTGERTLVLPYRVESRQIDGEGYSSEGWKMVGKISIERCLWRVSRRNYPSRAGSGKGFWGGEVRKSWNMDEILQRIKRIFIILAPISFNLSFKRRLVYGQQ